MSFNTLPAGVSLVLLYCPVVTEVYMAAMQLVATNCTAPFGRRFGRARGVWAGSPSDFGSF